jgi:HD superfamily phosphodiesterase
MDIDEEKFIEIIKPYLLECRDGDLEHSFRVVSWVKRLGQNREDLDLLLLSGYLHDIGWYKILPEGKLTLKELKSYEQEANRNSSVLVNKILKPLDYSDDQISTINRIIKSADKHLAEEEDEEILVDADNLSKLDINHLKEKYKPEEWLRVINFWEQEFPRRIKTNIGKDIYPNLLVELKSKISNNE